MKAKYLVAVLLPVLLSACGILCDGERPDRPPRPERPERPGRPEAPPVVPPEAPSDTAFLHGTPVWNDMDDVEKALGSLATISGTHVDLNGNAISGREITHPQDAQSEDAIPLKIEIANFVLENGFVRDIPGGIVVRKNGNTFRSLTFLESGEDFISTPSSGVERVTIEDCKFYNYVERDKSLQISSAKDAVIRRNYFRGAITAIRLGASANEETGLQCHVEDNVFERLSTGTNISGHTTAYARGNSYYTVRYKWVIGDDASVEYR